MDLSNVIEAPSKIERLFLHFFDTHFIAEKGSIANPPAFENEMRLATRMAVASANIVYVPAASYYESELCRKILGELNELVDYGIISLVGSSPNLEEYLRERQDESFYRVGSSQYDWYRAQHVLGNLPPYQTRTRSATRDVTSHWNLQVSNDNLSRLLSDAIGSLPKTLEARLEIVPNELGKLAFVPEHVFEILDFKDGFSVAKSRIRGVVNEGYFDSYVRDLDCGVIIDLSHLASSFRMPSYGQNLSYMKILRMLQEKGILSDFLNCPPSQLGVYGNDLLWRLTAQTTMAYAGQTAQSSTRPGGRVNSGVMMVNSASTLQDVQIRKILCVAAAQVEYETITHLFSSVFGKGRLAPLCQGSDLYANKFVDPDSDAHWYLVSLPFQGNIEASSRVPQMDRALNPDLILMVGMCMGIPGRDIPIGSVMVPNEVMGFDHRRITDKGEQFRLHGIRADTALYNIARLLTGAEHDYRVITDKGLASSNVKLETPDNDLINHIKVACPDAAAFDMEGSGFYGGLKDNNKCLWVKGVADSGEPQVATTAGRDEKQVSQREATENAVKFAIEVVRAWIDAQIP